jgi:baseplate J-like protein
MHTSTLFCKDDQRRAAVRRKPGVNGLDYLDVSSDEKTLTVYFLGRAPEQLLIREGEDPKDYKKRLRESVRVEGGRRIRGIKVTEVRVQQSINPKTGAVDPEVDDWMEVELDKYGDFSTYTLRLVGVENIDPRYDHLDFSFKVDCPSDLDCLPADTCPPPKLDEPDINYLAKDYAGFRQLILDRLALILPDWKERHVPDSGIALVELLAYIGDHLSYYQDAVATEAYLDSARQRISVRRHARLVDYHMHEGCNARAWVCIETKDNLTLDPREVYFVTGNRKDRLVTGTVLTAETLQQIQASQYEVFEPMTTEPIRLYAAHSEMHFYTWEERECCLPHEATQATLIYDWKQLIQTSQQQQQTHETPKSPLPTADLSIEEIKKKLPLKEGNVLIFEEVSGPRTGNRADADPAHRHAVRLTKLTPTEDPLNGQPIVEIEWGAEDALPFPLCISVLTDASHGCLYKDNISVARGNIILVDHGFTQPREDLGVVPCAASQAECDCEEHPREVTFLPGRFHPQLRRIWLTFRQPLLLDDLPRGVPAAQLMKQDARQALPQIIELKSAPPAPAINCEELQPLFHLADLLDLRNLVRILRNISKPAAQALRARLSKETLEKLGQLPEGGTTPPDLSRALVNELEQILLAWSAQFDLLSSGPDDAHVVVEIDNDGRAHLRFGNGELGGLPQAGSAFFVKYRTGNGIAGNVGAEMITHLALRNTTLSGVTLRVRNPLPAQGGTEPEPMAEVKLMAPFAFRRELQRAITANDYAQLAQRAFSKQVQQGAATLTWTGSWYEAEVSVDPFRSQEADAQLLEAVERRLYSYRRIGHDLTVSSAQYVPLDIALKVCVKPGYLTGHVKAALLNVFSNRVLPDGKLGFFHPDNLMFGGGIYLSKLVAAAQAVTGVESVEVTTLQRLYEGDQKELEAGVLQLGSLEVARLDNDPSFPERGHFTLELGGGR